MEMASLVRKGWSFRSLCINSLMHTDGAKEGFL